MSSIVLAGNSYTHGTKAFLHRIPLLNFDSSRAASLNSAIGRGLRRSKGVGFRGRERPQGRSVDGRNGLACQTADPSLPNFRGRMTSDAWKKENTPIRKNNVSESSSSSVNSMLRMRRGKKDIRIDKDPPRRSRAARFNDPNHSFGKRSLERRGISAQVTFQSQGRGLSKKRARTGGDGQVAEGRRGPQIITSAARRAAESDQIAYERNPGGKKLSKGRLAYLARIEASSQRVPSERSGGRQGDAPTGETHNHDDKDAGSRSVGAVRQPLFRENRPVGDINVARFMPAHATSTRGRDRLPLSIPYTTPASEFLYGTSVVEAALRSHRSPRRKLYKLYVYAGENRENAERDAGIERLAKKSGVEVVHADTSWLRLLDKMSSGRPHNGYILEASPLPKLPITSLGELISQDGKPGFLVSLDYQSREEAAINGTSNFIPLPRNAQPQGRKPFVLLLDSILDPGNLGGIVRTASFLGVTAIAICTRNSAPFSPVVLKASAGASETITLFSVNKPAAFIVESKPAGWKVYAAVAPSSSVKRISHHLNSPSNTHTGSEPLTIEELNSPLERDPCILMLGNEGEGLRWNLRSKADMELAINGAGHGAGGVDSLNVSVAAGILCNAFMSRRDCRPSASGMKVGEKMQATAELWRR